MPKLRNSQMGFSEKTGNASKYGTFLRPKTGNQHQISRIPKFHTKFSIWCVVPSTGPPRIAHKIRGAKGELVTLRRVKLEGCHGHGGTPIAGWVMMGGWLFHGKPENKMDDNCGYTHNLGNLDFLKYLNCALRLSRLFSVNNI